MWKYNNKNYCTNTIDNTKDSQRGLQLCPMKQKKFLIPIKPYLIKKVHNKPKSILYIQRDMLNTTLESNVCKNLQ